ncbi:hypothetical protein SAMN05216332_1187 [Nitrosospira briensis]|nr:hypothetical protein SAMN05216332_1187 [Nitrosospira briensis]
MNLQAQRDISRKLATWLLPADISEFQEKRITNGNGPLQHMGRRGLSTPSPALKLPSYIRRSPSRRRSSTCAALIILAR